MRVEDGRSNGSRPCGDASPIDYIGEGALRITVGGTSKLVDRKSAGLIARQSDANDRRAARVVLTRDGDRVPGAAIKTVRAGGRGVR